MLTKDTILNKKNIFDERHLFKRKKNFLTNDIFFDERHLFWRKTLFDERHFL